MKKSCYFLSLLPILLFITILLSTSCLAVEYYIDEEIEVFDNGDAVVKGETNIEFFSDLELEGDNVEGITSELTSKSGKIWSIDYKTDYIVSNYIIKIRLPKNIMMSNIQPESGYSIEPSNNGPLLTFIGQDMALDIHIEYLFLDKVDVASNYLYYYLLVILIIFVVPFFIWGKIPLKKQKKKNNINDKQDKNKTINKTKLDAIKLTLNETQLKIIDALLSQKCECSQTKLRHLTGIPKASLSRNLELLAQKNIVSKFYNGTSNYIKIHVQLYE